MNLLNSNNLNEIMRKCMFFLFAAIYSIALVAVEPEEKKSKSQTGDFRLTKEIPTTSVKNQYRSNTCWSFATLSFLESELLRTSNMAYDLSEMFIVRNVYMQKADKYIRMHGEINFAGGGEPNDVINIVKSKGIMPEGAYSGLMNDSAKHLHTEMDKELKKFVDSIVRNSETNLVDYWQEDFLNIMDSYLGAQPKDFSYKGAIYNSHSYSKSLDYNLNDYIMLTSFTHHPFFEPFAIEIPDNWSWEMAYNIPLDLLIDVADYAIENNFSFVWAADYSEKGFMHSEGVAIVPRCIYAPDSKEEEILGEMSRDEFISFYSNQGIPIEEVEVTQEFRQEAFDNYSTTDDHGMHIVGKAKDIKGNDYYYVKNSWGTNNPYGGYLFVSEAYFQYKTIFIMLNKKALPQNLIDKLTLKPSLVER